MINQRPSRNQEPEPVRTRFARLFRRRPTPAETSRATLMTADPAGAFVAGLRQAQNLAAARADAERWKQHADSYAREAEEAKAALARVRAVKKSPSRSPYNSFTNAQDEGWDQALDAVHAALGTPEPCEPNTAGRDHPVHELLAALKNSTPHPMPTDLVRRYYEAIHRECCPRDHRELRPGYAAAANRAALGGPVTGVMTEADGA